MKILLLTPPMTQLNTPYPATAYLTGFLRERGFNVEQRDPALELVLRIFSRQGLEQIHDQMQPSAEVAFFSEQFESYRDTVDAAIRFLQGRDPSLALRIAGRGFLPEGPAFQSLQDWEQLDEGDLEWAFGSLGQMDRAKYFASLYLNDIATVVRLAIDGRFTLSRYGERLAAAVESFGPLEEAANAEGSLIDKHLDALTNDILQQVEPDLVGLSVPFPGNFLGALRIGRVVKEWRGKTTVVLGGGYINTELRQLQEPRLFDFVDYVTLDDGEQPLLNLLARLQSGSGDLFRTFVRKDGEVKFESRNDLKDIAHNDIGTPVYDGLDLSAYLSVCEMLNPMHRLWSDGRWNKLTLAHGCYWSKCSFCDISLDYIERYQEADINTIVSRMKAMIAETGQTGFHFVDEAAPPKILFALARRIIDEGMTVTWWGNIRFEKSFNQKMTDLLAASGCVAVTGGLEVASNRLLKLMSKGVTVEQVAKVTQAFSQSGVLVHAYLMYGFPTQTTEETIDSLERVRQLFENGCIQSAFWHRFAATVHSPVGRQPEQFGITLIPRPADAFCQNDVDYQDPVATDHEMLGRGLKKALYNYMLGIGLEEPLGFWFDEKVPKTSIKPDYIYRQLKNS